MNSLPLDISIHLHTKQSPPRIVGFLSSGDFAYWTHPPEELPQPDALIDVFYEDIKDYNEIDLQMAAEKAIMTSNELWHIKMLGVKQPKGHVSLFPRDKWRGHEQDAVNEVRRLIVEVLRWIEAKKQQ